MSTTKEKIIKLLKKEELPTSKVAFYLARSFYDTKKLLEELENDGEVRCKKVGNYKFWSLR